MKYLLLAFSLLFCTAVYAQPIIRTSVDSLDVSYAPCLDEQFLTQLALWNEGDSTAVLVEMANRNAQWVRLAVVPPWSDKNLLATGDTLFFNLRHFSSNYWEGYLRDTIIISTGFDTIRIPLAARAQVAQVRSNDTIHVSEVRVGDTARMPAILYNDGEADFVVEYIPQYSLQIQGIQKFDTIPANGSRTVELIFTHTGKVGSINTQSTIIGSCGQVTVKALFNVVQPRAHWSELEIADVLTGCPDAAEYTFTLENRDTISVLIDSIRLSPFAGSWTLANAPEDNLILAPGEVRSLTIRAEFGAKATSITAYPSGLSPNTLPINVRQEFAAPILTNFRDTLVFDLEAGASTFVDLQIRNRGLAPYNLTKVWIEGDTQWSSASFDTAKAITLSKTITLSFPFSGASAGIYTATAYIQGAPCDTILKQVLVARVLPASVESAQGNNISLSISNNLVTAHGISHFNYTIVSVTGVEVLRGFATEASIDVSQLAKGLYFMKMGDRDQSTVLKFFK
ncbi:MAG TPA: T9SS type A sorting domain-containing protein [Candidatus Kapabacteria bacterium]|nr:T9SS type A sorting domain-containing protein [Candidatus Kapabacteria bacterium]